MKVASIFNKVLYILFCILIITFICANLFVSCFISQYILKHFGFQFIFYSLFSIFIILSIITIIFLKNLTLRLKFAITISCFIFFSTLCNLPAIKEISNIKNCYKTGICAKGLKATTKDNINFIINKENCEKYNYIWNNLKQTCDLRSEKLNKTK